MTSEEIISELRNIWGLTAVDYPDATLSLLITKSRNKISEYYPELELTYTTTVADQTQYTVANDNLIKLKHVYYTDSADVDNVFSDPEIKQNVKIKNDTFSFSTGFELIQRIKMLKQLYPVEGVIIKHNKFDLLPTPSTTGNKIYYEYERVRTLAEIPEMFKDDIIDLILFYIKDVQYKKMARLQGGNKYRFDRRGNNTEIANPVNEEKEHQNILTSIIKSIKEKVIKL